MRKGGLPYIIPMIWRACDLNLVMISSLALKWQVLNVGMPVFQALYEVKLKAWNLCTILHTAVVLVTITSLLLPGYSCWFQISSKELNIPLGNFQLRSNFSLERDSTIVPSFCTFTFHCAKGQSTSEGLFDVFKSAKKPTNFLKEFLP
jgi:hypothetical protein